MHLHLLTLGATRDDEVGRPRRLVVRRQISVQRTSSASADNVCGILRHHPETAVAAILALSYPATNAHGATPERLRVGGVMGSTSYVVRVAMEWEVDSGGPAAYGFVGELIVTSCDVGSHLELTGVLRGGSSDEGALGRVLGWLSSAADPGTSAPGTK